MAPIMPMAITPRRLSRIALTFMGAVALAAPLTAPSNAAESQLETFACEGQPSASALSSRAPRDIQFDVGISSDDGDLLGIVDPESGKVRQLAYDAEISHGFLKFPNEIERPVLWTRGKRNGGDYVGETIAADGEIITVRINRRTDRDAGSVFALFDTERQTLFSGKCR